MKIENLIIDVRPVQEAGRASPLARAFLLLAQQLMQSHSVTVLATHKAPWPAELPPEGARVIYALPIERKALTLMTAGRGVDEVRPHIKPFVRSLSVTWRERPGGPGGYVVAGTDLPDLPVGRGVFSAPVVSDLDRLQLDFLESISVSLIVVDGVVASDKDVMRDLIAAVRGTDTRIVTLGGASVVEAPEVLALYLEGGGVRELVAKSNVVLLPKGEPETVTSWEVEAWGGAWFTISAGDVVKSLADLYQRAIRAGSVTAEDAQSGELDALISLPVQEVPPAPLRPRLALVSPMFPDLGGPPHSSLDLAMALAELCELDVWTDSDMLPLHRKRVNGVYRLSDVFPADRYDEVVYVLGNHRMYEPIYALMRRHGGIVIQHDAHMLDFLDVVLGREGLERLLLEELGERRSAHPVTELIKSLSELGRPLLSPIVELADGVVVHSPTARSVIDQLYDSHVEYFPVGMPYTFSSEEVTSDKRLSAKYGSGIDPDVPCIISFGEVHLQKGAKQCLFVLNELKAWGVRFQFLFVGPVQDELRRDLEGYIDRLGLSDCVRIVGAVSEDQYARYLVAGDIVLQIRQVPFGQVSGALLDAVSAGMHGVASESLGKSIEAPEFIRLVVDGSSPTIYAEQLAELITSKKYENRPSSSWDGFKARHEFHTYARNLLNMIFGRDREVS
ncbi:glycosyltransferase involved in cell wall biosynthesis [Brevundimonas nasdae]|uniref:glycosyltransferase n=1 Tax=Brevundimonas nasdae TaxID=172043 RepID=UPI00191144BF|nr:glycosyltransferase [Brevundimonas nasdae]MBK6026666.1 hypothetical protein [Brevundimonas nasdae]MDQ0453414.1 glycosyltransferase involved in cell wall biosynthesis [Brevundimonas nasdae]